MRLPPLPAEEWDEVVEQSLSGMLPAERRTPQDAGNALSTFARHPALTKAFLRFNVHLLYSSTLPPRIRELAILRVAHRRECTYEWTQHVALAKKAGKKGAPEKHPFLGPRRARPRPRPLLSALRAS